MKYTNISEGLPLLPGMYIVVYKLSNGVDITDVHALRYFNDGKWSGENLNTSSIIAYAGPIEQYKEEN